MSVDGLYDSAAQLLDEALSGLGADRTGHDPPGRVYVAHGIPAVDPCEGTGQLTVTIAGLESRPSATRARVTPDPNQNCALVPVGLYMIQLWRCVPVPDENLAPPRPEVLTDSAMSLAADAWAMVTWLYARRAALSAIGCGGVGIGPCTPFPPLGGTAGWKVDVEITLDGMGPS